MQPFKLKPRILDKARQEVLRLYGNQLRLRVCGICIENNQILLLNHRGVGQTNTFWCPPGGGIQFGETATEALVREYEEETGLEIVVQDLLFVHESVRPPLHAMELFFEVKIRRGIARIGTDPEMSAGTQIIQELRWLHFEEIKNFPPNEVHVLFQACESLADVKNLKGYLKGSPVQV